MNFGKKYTEKGEKITGGIELFSINESLNDMKLKIFNQGNRTYNLALTSSDPDSAKVFYYQAIDKFNLVLKWDPQAVINGQPYVNTVYGYLVNTYMQLINIEKDEANKKLIKEKGLEYLIKFSEIDKTNLSIIYNIYYQYFEDKNYEKSIEWINKGLAVKSDDSLSKVIKAILVERKAYIYDSILGKADEALKTYEELIQNDPNNPDWHFNLARLYFTRNQHELAIEQLKIVKKLKPTDEESNYQVADEMFISYQKQRSNEIEKNGGTVKADMKKVTESLKPAIDACKQNLYDAISAIEKNLDNASNKAESYYRIGRFYNFIAELEGNLAFNLENKEKVKIQKPYFEKAVKNLTEATTLKPDHRNAWHNLFIAYTNLQMAKERDAALKKFNELGK
jgi:tetratricopeptide (TPR) repeat protein